MEFKRNHGVGSGVDPVGQEYAQMGSTIGGNFNSDMGAFVRCIRADGMVNGAID
jgi:hypothetical protein